jgi:hypothetical protein
MRSSWVETIVGDADEQLDEVEDLDAGDACPRRARGALHIVVSSP